MQLLWWRSSLILFGVSLLTLTACGGKEVELPALDPTIEISSPAFTANGLIPKPYTCDGNDLSPALSWTSLPPETQSLALIVDDPDAPNGTFVHWVLYRLPPDTQQLAEGVSAATDGPDGSLQGKNGFGKLGYRGPCPPSGTHRYVFKLYALDQVVEIPAKATKNKVLLAIKDHIIARGELIGQYKR